MPHAFAASNRLRDEVAIFVDRLFTRTNAFKLRIMRVDIFRRPENTLTEEAVALWLLGAVVDSFGFSDFAVAPVQDVFRGSHA